MDQEQAQVEPQELETQTVVSPRDVLVDTIIERWGYHAHRRALASLLMKSTSTERTKVTQIGKQIAGRLSAYLAEGADVRGEVVTLQGELVQAKSVLKTRAQPLYDKMAPFVKAVSYLDRIVIPGQIEAVTGKKLEPITEISPSVLKALAKPPK
ncbi:MAG: hypothetical protein Q8O47_09885 [Candidatus Bathyarchaeota archaeon]|nr:hypothetical protein [Candidatus Bathyarchaeota archaeon]